MLIVIRDKIANGIKAGKSSGRSDRFQTYSWTLIQFWGKGFLKTEQFVKIVYGSSFNEKISIEVSD